MTSSSLHSPPDDGLQAERTSLSWARTWAVLGVDITLVVKLVAEASPVGAAALAMLTAVPLIALVRVRMRHHQRVRRFVRAGEVHQTDWAYNSILVAMILVLAAVGLAAIVLKTV